MKNLIADTFYYPNAVTIILIGLMILVLFWIVIDMFHKPDLRTKYITQLNSGIIPQVMRNLIATSPQNQMLCVSCVKNIKVKKIKKLFLVKCTFYENENMAQAAEEVANQVSRVISYMPSGSVPPNWVRFCLPSLPIDPFVFRNIKSTLNQMSILIKLKRAVGVLYNTLHFKKIINENVLL